MLKNRLITSGAALVATGFIAMAGAAQAAPAQLELLHKGLVGETLDWPVGQLEFMGTGSGSLDNFAKQQATVYDKTIAIPVAGWLRLYFGEVELAKGSFVRVTSLFDDEVQVLDAGTLDRWGNTTAYFNGNAVRVELVAAPGSHGNSIQIEYVAFQDVATIERGDGCGICGPDDRQPTSNDNFGRLYPYGCSATLYNQDNCLVTAGHCLGGQTVVQFRVPNSGSDCYTNNPGVADQFPITASDGLDGGVGADYGAVKVGANSSGQTPFDRYGVFIPPASSVPGSGTATVSGYGVDDECVYTQTLQVHSGPISGVSGTTMLFDIDITYGNSGSSIIVNNEIVGVVTHCSFGCENYGTTITSGAFQSAMESACLGNGGGGGGCAAGEIEDCFGNCCPADWVGDTYCDDGTYSYNGVPIYLNCEEFNCDNGDCDPSQCDGGGGGGGTGACCLPDDTCTDGVSSDDCSAFGGVYQGDDSSCNSVECGNGGGGGPCDAGFSADCLGTCFPDYVFDAWIGDGFCDDGAYIPFDYGCEECPPGVAMYLNCDEYACDNGDCDPSQCEGGGGGDAGACCVGASCTDGVSPADCAAAGGDYQGNGTSCNTVECGGGGAGACCIGDICNDSVPSSDCAAFGGSYQGDDTVCGDVDCGGGGGGSGDLCTDAVDASLGGNAFDTSGNTDSGFGDPDDSQCADTFLDWGASPDFWFRWTAPGDGTASFSTCDAASYDTSLVLYAGASCNSLVQVACNGDAVDSTGCQGYHSQIDGFSVSEGDVYYIRLGGWEGASGAGTLTIDGSFSEPETGACCLGDECLGGYTQAECDNVKGEYLGTGSTCDDGTCAGEPCPGDANGDGSVNVADLLGVIGEWQCTNGCQFDANGDGTVNVTDLLEVIGNWGPCS